MIRMRFAGKLLQVVAAVGIVTAGVSVASAQTNGGSMAGMKMGPSPQINSKSQKAAPKKLAHKKDAHEGAHHKVAAKSK